MRGSGLKVGDFSFRAAVRSRASEQVTRNDCSAVMINRKHSTKGLINCFAKTISVGYRNCRVIFPHCIVHLCRGLMVAAARSRSWAPSCSTSHSSASPRAPPSCSCPGTCWGRARRRSSAWWPTCCSTVYDELDTLLSIEIVLSWRWYWYISRTHKKLREKIKYTLSYHKGTKVQPPTLLPFLWCWPSCWQWSTGERWLHIFGVVM